MGQKLIMQFAFTGGPGGGKSSGIEDIKKRLIARGIKVITVPEVATMIFSNGVSINDMHDGVVDSASIYEFQKQMFLMQKHLEDSFLEFAKLQPDNFIVVLYDRCLVNGKAYMDEALFMDMVRDLGFREVDIMEYRYDAIFHMVTSADGAEEFYNKSNTARYESAEDARHRDKRILQACRGHETFHVISNQVSGDKGELRQISFDEKLDLLAKAVLKELGFED